ncbi:MAG: hypothetical protein U9R08_05440 [Nanoarchaeota archaeon]|nr:hypothetical protein [Nanoarchaeota archaeon]
MKLAFDVSIEDMVRKKADRYHNPIDYLDDLIIGKMYRPRRKIDVDVYPSVISVKSEGPSDESFIGEIQDGDIFAKAEVLPPIAEYETVIAHTGNKILIVHGNRTIEVADLESENSSVEIFRERNGNDEAKRLKELYSNSDLDVRINGQTLEKAVGFEFDKDGVRGVIAYDKRSRGNVHYFNNGRFVDKLSSDMGGVDIFLHQHGLAPNVAKTKVLTKGEFRQENERINQALSDVFVDYVKQFNGSVQSYQTLMRNVHNKYPSASLNSVIKDKILFADRNGEFRKDYTLDYVTEHIGVRLSESDDGLYQSVMGESRQSRHKKLMEELRRKQREEMLKKKREMKKKEIKRSQVKSRVVEHDYNPLLQEVGTILNIEVNEGEAYSFSDGTLKVPRKALDNDALKIAMDAVPHIGRDESSRLELYSKIVKYSSGVNPEKGFFG